MRKAIFISLCCIIAAMFVACSSEDSADLSSDQLQVEVGLLSDYLASSDSRSVGEDNEGDSVLVFKTEDDYRKFLAKVKKMSQAERLSYFESLGFEGAYSIVARADNELESLFDEEVDSITFTALINRYLERYENVFEFEGLKDNDVTPSLSFKNEDLHIAGNLKGYVVVANQVLNPDDYDDKFKTEDDSSISPLTPTYNGKFIEYVNANVKNGSYTSYLRVGRIGEYMAFKTETYRKKFFFFKSYSGCGHDAGLEISCMNNTRLKRYVIHHGRGQWILGDAKAADYSPRMIIRVKDFRSTLNSNKKVSNNYYNVLVR
ncbi:MAG: DUF4848 domain-containing protein [Muribaculaceae bacterium]|nr:DUF4848 domain-containing protein [Muribaculaceae bacterium]